MKSLLCLVLFAFHHAALFSATPPGRIPPAEDERFEVPRSLGESDFLHERNPMDHDMHLPDALPHFADPQSEENHLGYLMEKSHPVEGVLKPHWEVSLHRSSQDSASSSLEQQYTRDEEDEQINRQPTSNKGIYENRTMWGRKDPAVYLNSPRPSLQVQRNNQPGTPVSLKVKPSVGTKRQGGMYNNSLQQRMKLRSHKEDTGMLESSRNQINPTLGYMEGWSSESTASNQSQDTHMSTDSLEDGISKEEAPMRGHHLKDIEKNVWLRISSIGSTINQSAAEEMMRSVRPSIPILLVTCHPSNENSSILRNQNMPQSSMNDVEVVQKIKKFACLLWTLNLRALDLIDAKESKATYLEEQNEFMKWFANFMFHSNHQILKPLPNSMIPLRFIDTTEGSLYQDTLKAIHSKHCQPSYKVFLDGLREIPVLISDDQVSLTQAAVGLVIHYYKNKNFQKWNHFFGEEKHFVIQISNFEPNWIERLFQRSELMVENHAKNQIIPWEFPCSPEFLEHFPKSHNLIQFKFADLVKEILPPKKDKTINTLVSKSFQLDHQEDSFWVWLVRHALKEGIKAPEKFKPTSWFKTNVKDYLEVEIENLDKDQKKQFELNYEAQFLEKISKLFDYLYVTNGRFISFLGCSDRARNHHKEQRSIKKYLESILLKPQRTDPNLEFQDEEEDTIAKLFKELFLLQGNEPFYTVQHYKRNTEQVSVVTMEDIILMKITLNIIGSYYKATNHEKWSGLFSDDNCLFHLFMKASCDTFNFRSNVSQMRRLKFFRGLRLFPWEKSTSTDSLSAEVRKTFLWRDWSYVNKWMRKYSSDVSAKSSMENYEIQK